MGLPNPYQYATETIRILQITIQAMISAHGMVLQGCGCSSRKHFPFALSWATPSPAHASSQHVSAEPWMSLEPWGPWASLTGLGNPGPVGNNFFVVAGLKKGNCLPHPYVFWQKPPVLKAACGAVCRRASPTTISPNEARQVRGQVSPPASSFAQAGEGKGWPGQLWGGSQQLEMAASSCRGELLLRWLLWSKPQEIGC